MTTDPLFNFVSQMAHWLASAFATLAVAHLFGAHALMWFVPCGIAAAAVKEFWYDLRFETPAVSGEIDGGVEDFAFYVIGFVVGGAVLVL